MFISSKVGVGDFQTYNNSFHMNLFIAILMFLGSLFKNNKKRKRREILNFLN